MLTLCSLTHIPLQSFLIELIAIPVGWAERGGGDKVLLVDEPTSSVDVATDESVHSMLLQLDNTVIMICHRLEYIARFDKVFILHDGSIIEEGVPRILLADSNSALSGLCRQAGMNAKES
jgi:ABC-type multidrug transport system fused ATPase/permease subunit